MILPLANAARTQQRPRSPQSAPRGRLAAQLAAPPQSTRRRAIASRALALGALLSSACAHLELSHETVVDFERYPSVAVQVRGSVSDATYLVEELREVSGFDEVALAPAPTTTLLSVRLYEQLRTNGEGDESLAVTASYELTDAAGALLAHGSVQDQNSLPDEAREDALDEVAAVFIPAYDY